MARKSTNRWRRSHQVAPRGRSASQVLITMLLMLMEQIVKARELSQGHKAEDHHIEINKPQKREP